MKALIMAAFPISRPTGEHKKTPVAIPFTIRKEKG